MKKTVMILACATLIGGCMFAFVGCKSIEVERRGQQIATDSSGQIVKSASGEPLVLDMGWEVDYFQHWNWQKFDSLEAVAGSATLKINNYQSGADTNLTALVNTSITGLGELATKVAAAYAQVAGGGAQADTVASLAAKAVQLFASKGGDTSAATVSTSGNVVTVTDGTATVTCKDGECSYVESTETSN